MQRIKSFDINHDTLEPGLYTSRIDGDAISYDLRFYKPNNGTYFSTGTLHTLEHLLATSMRNSKYKDYVIYVGPMGCRTGFYLVTRDKLTKTDVLALVKDALLFAKDFKGIIPGSEKIECGNYLDHDLDSANKSAEAYYQIIKNWTVNQFDYLED